MAYTFLPDARFSITTAAPATPQALAQTSQSVSERQLTLAAENGPIRITYGRDRLGARIANVLFSQGYWVVQVVWGEGQIQAVESYTFSDKPVSGIEATHYLGTSGQTVNSRMVVAMAEVGVVYTDALPGIAYSVFRIPASTEGWENISAIIQGRLLYDPRTGLTVYSNNPALALADFLVNSVYGARWTVNWASVEAAADYCDELVGGVKRRTIGLTLDAVTQVDNWIETLRTYAGCLRPVIRNGEWHLIPDRVTATTKSFNHNLGQIAEISPIKKRGVRNSPTVVTVKWTDTSVLPWKERDATVRAPGVLEGTTPLRESQVRLEGIQNVSQATREAIERYNKENLSDISFTLAVFGEGLEVEVGDVVEVTHPVGLAAKRVRVLGVEVNSPGRYGLTVSEYDPASYSDSIVSEPSSADTSLPNPAEPIPPDNLVLAEALVQLQNGKHLSGVVAGWDLPAFPFVDYYRVNVLSGSTIVATGTAKSTDTSWPSPPLPEDVTYQVDVYTISHTGASSVEVSDTITLLGKLLLPGDVPALFGFEVNGELRLRWSEAVDIDIEKYRIKYGPVGVTWAAGIVIDTIDALTYTTRDVPVGTWDVMVKAVDSVQQESALEARLTVVVTSDGESALVDAVELLTADLTNAVQVTLGRLDDKIRFVTEDGVVLGTKLPGALAGYTAPLITYNTGASSVSMPDATSGFDFGQSLSGNWTATTAATALEGTITETFQIGPDGTTFTDYSQLSVKATGRYAKVKVSAADGSALKVELPLAEIRLNAVTSDESHTGTSSATLGTLVQLDGNYSRYTAITVTPIGSTDLSGHPDRVLLSSQDGLVLKNKVAAGGGNRYAYQKISDAGSRVIASGDHLEYEVFVETFADPNSGGMDIVFTDASHLRGTVSADDATTGPINLPVGLASGTWVARKHNLVGAVGKTAAHVSIVNEADAEGEYQSVYRNIRITDGASTTRLALWSSGEPAFNTTFLQTGQTQVQCGPSNSYMVYVFSSGIQSANDFITNFSGV